MEKEESAKETQQDSSKEQESKVAEDKKSQENWLQEISDLKEKLKECENKYLRVFADFENSKKRLEKDKIQAIEYSLERFAQDLLPALDSLDMALSVLRQQDLETEKALLQLKDGIELTISQFVKAFNKHGIEVIEIEEGGEFNPHLHEALLQVEDAEKKAGDIVQVIQKGYKYKERVLRPAKVSVAK
jgi:molecular chaperone GrpE